MATNQELSTQQKDYVRKRVDKVTQALRHCVREYNPNLSVSSAIDPYKKTIKIEVVEQRHGKHGVRHIASLNGEFHLYWNQGKRLILYIPTMNDPKTVEVSLHRRANLGAEHLFSLLLPSLPARDPAAKQNFASQAAMPAKIALHDGQAGTNRMVAKENKRRKRTHDLVTYFESYHIDYIDREIARLETAFYKRMSFLFNNVSFDPKIDMQGPEKASARLDIRLRPHAKFHVPGTPAEIRINGNLSLRWRFNAGNGTRIDFTPAQGLPNRRVPYASMNLSRKLADVTRELYNLLVSSGLLANSGKKSKNTMASGQTLERKPRIARRDRPRPYHRAGRDSNARFAARVKRGGYVAD